jgi:hypothetical protein
LGFIERIIEQYPILYTKESESTGNEFGGGFNERWGWYQSFVRLARELRCRLSDVEKENLHESLTLLSYLIDESKEEERQIKNNQIK